MRPRLVARRLRRLMCMAGMHQFTDAGERCVSPGCRAPNDARPSSEILEEIGGAGIGSRRARAHTHGSARALGSWRWRFRTSAGSSAPGE
jgi:hypothetical protein